MCVGVLRFHKGQNPSPSRSYSVTSTFDREASEAVLDLTMDDDTRARQKATAKHWDPKKKKYVGNSNVSLCR